MSALRRIMRRVGISLLALGVLLLLFVAFQLWGTSLFAWHAQDRLRSQLSHDLHRRLPTSASQLSGKHRWDLPNPSIVPARDEPDPPEGSPVALLSIPKVGLLDTVVEGVNEGDLEQGPGHYPGTPLPGEFGNSAIAGHRTTYAHPFYNLNELVPGDSIFLLTSQGFFRYDVQKTLVVVPTDVAVLATTSSLPTLTLTTCNPRYSAAQRMVVVATFDGYVPPHAPPPHSKRLGVGNGAFDGNGASMVPAILWGIATLAAAAATWISWKLGPRKLRWVFGIVGTAGVLVLLFFCFTQVSRALPASF